MPALFCVTGESDYSDQAYGINRRRKIMYDEIKNLKVILENYFAGKISKVEIGNWAKKEYYKILLGEFVILEKLAIYKFVRKLSTIHNEPNDAKDEFPITNEECNEIYNILSGQKDAVFSGKIKLHKNIYKNLGLNEQLAFYLEIKEMIISFYDSEDVTQIKKDKYEKFIKPEKRDIDSVIDILQTRISEKLGYWLGDIFQEHIVKEEFWLYINKDDITREGELKRLLNLLDCIIGDSYFEVSIIYDKGICHFAIEV